jgi:hypothetical protein
MPRRPVVKWQGFLPVERPPDSVDLEDALPGLYALQELEESGDPQPLIERLGSSAPLLPEERAHAAALLRALWTRGRRGRPADSKVKVRAVLMALDVSLLMMGGLAKKAAVADVALREKVSPSTVHAAVRANPQFFPEVKKLQK